MIFSVRNVTGALAVLGLAFIAPFPAPGASGRDTAPDPNYIQRADDYWLGRQNLDNVHKGISLLREDLDKYPRDYEAWWRVSRLDSFVARHSSGSGKSRALNDGISAGKRAMTLQAGRVEGHFWLGVNEGLLAEEGGLLEGLRLVDNIRKERDQVSGPWGGYITGRLSSKAATSDAPSDYWKNASASFRRTRSPCSIWLTATLP